VTAEINPADLIIRDVPVIIEPCVQIIEAACAVSDSFGGNRVFPLQLYRLSLSGADVDALPFVPSTTAPHVFSPVTKLAETLLLLIYDHAGRLHTVYKRPEPRHAWNRYPVYEETAGRATTAHSVRFCFRSEKQRLQFLALAEVLIQQEKTGVVNYDDVSAFTRALSRLRVPPVMVPVAVPTQPGHSL
jgi:hypothetical protein